ncbi:MAG: MCE family protein [Candidatus Eisenbacteria bacterium]
MMETNPRSKARSSLRWFTLLSLGLLAATFALACQSAGGGSEITALYPNASGLEEGAEVRMSDFQIGTVESVDLEPDGRVAARIRIFPKYAAHITEGSELRIKRRSVADATRFIEVKPGTGEPLADGARIDGMLTLEDRLRSLGKSWVDSVEELDVKAQLEELTEAAKEAAEEGLDEWEARRPEFEAEAKELLKRLEEEGGEAVEKLRKEIEEYLDEIEKETETESGDSQTI